MSVANCVPRHKVSPSFHNFQPGTIECCVVNRVPWKCCPRGGCRTVTWESLIRLREVWPHLGAEERVLNQFGNGNETHLQVLIASIAPHINTESERVCQEVLHELWSLHWVSEHSHSLSFQWQLCIAFSNNGIWFQLPCCGNQFCHACGQMPHRNSRFASSPDADRCGRGVTSVHPALPALPCAMSCKTPIPSSQM